MKPTGPTLALVAALAFAGCSASGQDGETLGVSGLQSQRVSGAEMATVAGTEGFAEVWVLVTVGTDGKVLEAKVADNSYHVDPEPALAAAREWVFRPQSFEGRPIRAEGTIGITYRMPEVPPDRSVPFPAAAPGETEIVLERTACFGSCPDYKVAIRGDGTVRFSTRDMDFPETAAAVHRMFNGRNVLWSAPPETRVDPQAVAALVERFRAAHFMGLKSEYVSGVTDNPTYTLTLRVGNTTKTVTDYVGREVGMPASVTALEDAVDALAGTARWVRGNAGTIALLKAQGFDFGSQDAAELVFAGIRLNAWPPDEAADAVALIRGAVAEGLDLTARVNVGEPGGSRKTKPIGVAIAGFAASTGSERLFADMAQRGQVALMDKRELDEAFADGAGCSARIARALAAAGASPRARGANGNALHAVRSGFGACSWAGADARAALARALVELRVPLEARDDLGWTPLMGCDDPEVARVLLAAGADPNAHDDEGTTPVLSVDDDRVALLLLRAGADPRARDGDGTVREVARGRHWPGSLAWLDAHGVR